MPKKTDTNELPKSLADPKFAQLRELLIGSVKENKKLVLAHYFDGMSEEKRSEYTPFCLEWYKFLKKTCLSEYPYKLPKFFHEGSSVNHAFLAVKTAILACCTQKEIEKVLRENGPALLEAEFEEVMCSRRPAWLADILLWMGGNPALGVWAQQDYWHIYRRFVREKIVKPIKNDLWIRTMFTAMLFDTQDHCDWKAISLFDQLHADPELLETDIWYYFDFARFPNGWNLTSRDGHFSWERETRKGEDWKGTICTLIQSGEMPKQRVIDGCFQSLGRQFSDHESKWYVQLLELLIDRLQISDDELVDDSRYISLLHNLNPAPRALGLKILERLFKSGKIQDGTVVEQAAGILREPAKAKAKKSIGMLEKIAKRNSNLHGEVFHALVEGLQHEAAEIQQASLELLLKYDALNDTAVAESVTRIAESLAPSVRKLLPQTQTTQKTEKTKHYEPLPPSKIAPEKIVPITTFDELLDAATRQAGYSNDMDEFERLLDALSRIGMDKPADFAARTDPLLAQIQKAISGTDILDVAKNKWSVYLGWLKRWHCVLQPGIRMSCFRHRRTNSAGLILVFSSSGSKIM
ncbi:MAG: DUF6493 family protein [Planctomycetaceae bacterium]|nr:DUF6493 family protein [Planctomycetaceae bacterium]